MDEISKGENSQEVIPSVGGGVTPPQTDAAANEEAPIGATVQDGAHKPANEVAAVAAGKAAYDAVSQDDLDALFRSIEADPPEPVETSNAFLVGAADSGPQATAEAAAAVAELRPFDLPDLGAVGGAVLDAKRVSMLHDVDLHVKVELGRTRMLVEDVLKLGSGSVVELDKLAGDPVDVVVNDRLVARGEVLVLNDSFCVRISEVLSHDPHRIMA